MTEKFDTQDDDYILVSCNYQTVNGGLTLWQRVQ